MSTDKKKQSPFERRAYAYIERGYSVIPIAPGTKRPGQWSKEHGWRGMHDWERFGQRLPTEIELEHWYTWPDAGIGLLLGKLSRLTGLDRDYDTNGTDALDKIIPYTPVKKKGAKGWTGLYRYNGERSCSFNIAGMRVLDVLSDGRQTLMPGTIHPDGHTYIWLTEDILEDFDPDDLPTLPDDFLQQVERVLAPYQSDEDRKYARRTSALPADDKPINTDLSAAASYYRDLNALALRDLDAWVPKIIQNSRPERDGYRCIATWRNAKNHNVGVHPSGIFDFGGNYGMTPIDLVMYANGLTFARAAESLRACLPMKEQEKIEMTVGGVPLSGAVVPPAVAAAASAGAAPPALMPWQRQVSMPAPTPVQLPPKTSIDPGVAIPSWLANPPGILGEIARWIVATAPKAQPELALGAAIALCATVMGRTYRSQYGNWTSLYFILVAKSTEGKEHPQQCVERVLAAADLPQLIGGSGYTSAPAVYSALMKSPSHIVTIDELGKLLKLSRSKGNSHSEAAIDKLVEAFGRLDGIMRPQAYSDITSKEKLKIPVIHNPAITLLGATTPGTFYQNLTADLVHDGFLGRCIVIESKQPRQLTQFVERTEPPTRVIEWCKLVHVSGQIQGDLAGVMAPELPATSIELPFSESCMPILTAMEQELNDEKNATEGERLDVLLGRTQEKAMRLAMIVCKADNPANKVVEPEHLLWAIAFVRHYDAALIRAVRVHTTETLVDAEIKKMVEYVRNAKQFANDARYAPQLKEGLMPRSKLLKLMKMNAKQFGELLDTAVESHHLNRVAGHVYNCGCDVITLAEE